MNETARNRLELAVAVVLLAALAALIIALWLTARGVAGVTPPF
jgi:cytochrome c-type biogenesis protein CcmE